MKESYVDTSLSRRQFHTLITILEEDREEAAKSVEYYKKKEDDYSTDKYVEAMNRIRDIDMLIETLYGEDLS